MTSWCWSTTSCLKSLWVAAVSLSYSLCLFIHQFQWHMYKNMTWIIQYVGALCSMRKMCCVKFYLNNAFAIYSQTCKTFTVQWATSMVFCIGHQGPLVGCFCIPTDFMSLASSQNSNLLRTAMMNGATYVHLHELPIHIQWMQMSHITMNSNQMDYSIKSNENKVWKLYSTGSCFFLASVFVCFLSVSYLFATPSVTVYWLSSWCRSKLFNEPCDLRPGQSVLLTSCNQKLLWITIGLWYMPWSPTICMGNMWSTFFTLC